MTVRAMLGLVVVCALAAARAQAQTRAPDVTRELELFESTERDLDPLGLDEGTGTQLDEAARRLDEARRRAAQPKPLSATHGEVLSSVEGVQELSHQVRIQLAQGLAFVDLELRFAARAAQPAELAYRLPLPAGAALVALAVCRGARCTQAAPELAGRTPAGAHEAANEWVEATHIEDRRGLALSLRAASVARGAELTLRVRYVAPAELHAGVARFRLPARGYDPRVAPSTVSLSAPELVARSPAGEVTLDPNLPLELEARLEGARPLRSVSQARCGARTCTRRFEAAPSAPPALRETWLLLDASPSMEGPARNAADRALVALLSQLPDETPLRVFAFGASARELGRFQAAQAPLARLSDALLQDLGGASRPGAALALARGELARVRPRVLLLSDGKLDHSAVEELRQVRRAGAELWWIALRDEPSLLQPLCDGVVRIAAPVQAAHDEELLAAVLAPRLADGLRAGEQRVAEQAPARPAHTPRAAESWLSFWLARARPVALRTPGGSAAGVVAAPAFVSEAAPSAAPDTGMPKESVLSMLRNQLVPQARACLRTDRKGRGDYAVALTFHALFADREAYEVRVEGAIPDALRKCLVELVPRLRVPAFSGRIRVRYPIHTEREPESPVIELEGEALEQVNRVIGAKQTKL